MEAEWFEDFAKQVLEEKGVKAPDEGVERQLILDISEATRDVVLQSLLDSLNEEELRTLNKALDENDQDTIQKLMAGKDQIMASAMQRVRMKYLGA